MNGDYADLLASLNEHQVEFLVVGSYVLAFYGRPRYTEDLDIWIRRSEENVARLARALDDFGTPVNHERIQELVENADGMIVLGAAPYAIDFLNHVKGLEFEASWAARSKGQLFGQSVQVISKSDFVAAKRAAGRKKDLLDLALLEEVEDA